MVAAITATSLEDCVRYHQQIVKFNIQKNFGSSSLVLGDVKFLNFFSYYGYVNERARTCGE